MTLRMLTREKKREEVGERLTAAQWPLTPAKGPVRPELRSGLLTGAIVAVVVAALSGWLVRAATTPAPPPAPLAPTTADAGPVGLTVDGEWSAARSVPGLPGLDPDSTAAFTPADGLRAYALATVAPIRDGSLLPEPLRALLPAKLPKPKPATLLGLPALHYTEQAIEGDRRMEVTVVPTSAGALAVACVAPSESWVAALGCSAGVRQLSLRGAAWLEPGEDLAVQARIPGVVAKLDGKRAALRKRLAGAKTRRGQARFAARLSKAYGAAAASLAPVAPEQGAPAKLVASLKAESRSYARLSRSAARGWPGRYRMARRAVRRDDAALKSALAGLR